MSEPLRAGLRRLPALWLPLALGLLAAGCKPAAFARQEGELFFAPPPVMSEASGFWNDPEHGAFGEISLGAGLYRDAGRLCRPARQTVIDRTRQTTLDRLLLYCRTEDGTAGGGQWRLESGRTCREAGNAGLSCRDGAGNVVVLPPA